MPRRLMIMAGGTGGHIYPALAVAELWREGGDEVVWLGTRSGLESRLVPEAEIPVEWVQIGGLRRKGIISLLAAPFRLARALLQSLHAVRRQRPDVVLGMGGFVAGPGGVATWILRIPLVLHEQNAIAGLTNRLLSHLATQVLEAFPGTFPASGTVVCTGNPLRSALTGVTPAEAHQPLRLLVLGGSLGAQRLNQLVPEMAAALQSDEALEIYHQTGSNNLEQTRSGYLQHDLLVGNGIRVVPYIENMVEAYQWSDLVLCRAGAMTVSELAVTGRPAILVPFPYAVDDHQTANGQFLESKGAALLVQQEEIDGNRLLSMVREFIHNPQRIPEMGEQARNMSLPDAASRVVSICRGLC